MVLVPNNQSLFKVEKRRKSKTLRTELEDKNKNVTMRADSSKGNPAGARCT
jgi:hypothetical protein